MFSTSSSPASPAGQGKQQGMVLIRRPDQACATLSLCPTKCIVAGPAMRHLARRWAALPWPLGTQAHAAPGSPTAPWDVLIRFRRLLWQHEQSSTLRGHKARRKPAANTKLPSRGRAAALTRHHLVHQALHVGCPVLDRGLHVGRQDARHAPRHVLLDAVGHLGRAGGEDGQGWPKPECGNARDGQVVQTAGHSNTRGRSSLSMSAAMWRPRQRGHMYRTGSAARCARGRRPTCTRCCFIFWLICFMRAPALMRFSFSRLQQVWEYSQDGGEGAHGRQGHRQELVAAAQTGVRFSARQAVRGRAAATGAVRSVYQSGSQSFALPRWPVPPLKFQCKQLGAHLRPRSSRE